MKSKFKHKRIVVQDGQDLTIKIYGDMIQEERLTHGEIYDFLFYRHIFKKEFPKLIRKYWRDFNDV